MSEYASGIDDVIRKHGKISSFDHYTGRNSGMFRALSLIQEEKFELHALWKERSVEYFKSRALWRKRGLEKVRVSSLIQENGFGKILRLTVTTKREGFQLIICA